MKKGTTRLAKVRLGLLLAAHSLLFPALAAPGVPQVPEPPDPPSNPEVSVQGFRVRPGETHKGDVVRFAPSAAIQGTLDGDLYVTASTVTISGVVTGDVFVAGSVVDVSGEIQKSFRAAAANVVLDGTVHGNVLVTGGSLTLGSKAHVMGNVSAYTGQFTHNGVVDGSLSFTGGNATLGGKVLEDASLTADRIEIEPGARIEGDVSYSTRKPMDAQLKAIAGGEVTYDEAPVREKRVKHREDEDLRPTTFGVGKWIAFFAASFLFGAALIAVFGSREPQVTLGIGSGTLRYPGI